MKKKIINEEWIKTYLINLGEEIEEYNNIALEVKIRRIVREVFEKEIKNYLKGGEK